MCKKKTLIVFLLILFAIFCLGLAGCGCDRESTVEYTLEVKIVGEGQTSPQGPIRAPAGCEQGIRALPEEGWALDYFMVNKGNGDNNGIINELVVANSMIRNINPFTFVVNGDMEIAVVFVKKLALEPIKDKSVKEGEELSFQVSASCLEEAMLEYSARELPSGASFDSQTGQFIWTPAYDQEGIYQIMFQVQAGSLIDEELVQITVENTNREPVLAALGNKTVDVGANLRFTVSASDPDGHELSYSAEDLPAGASFDIGTQKFQWTPTYEQAGKYFVTFKVSDGILIDEETIVIIVNPETATEQIMVIPNRPVVLDKIGDKTVDAGANLRFTISASDPDGDELSYSAIGSLMANLDNQTRKFLIGEYAEGLPTGASFDSETQEFQWSPTYEQVGTYSFTFLVSDGIFFDEETIMIIVNPETAAEQIMVTPNRPAVLDEIGDKTVDAGANLRFTVSASDPDGDELSYSAENLPTGASFDNQTREFQWTPAHDQTGEYSVTFQVSDGILTDEETIRIIVRQNYSFGGGGSSGHVNRPPVLDEIGDKTTDEGDALRFTVSASNPDGDELSYNAEDLPAGASFDSGTQEFRWSPTYEQAGEYSVTFLVSDGILTDEDTIRITVNNVNRPPVLDDIVNQTVYEAQNLNFNITASDPDEDILSYSAEDLPTGAIFDSRTQEFQWTPKYGQAGEYSVIFKVSDGILTDEETITITVNDKVNYAPVLGEIGDQITFEGVELTFTVSASDPDGDELSYSADGLPAGASFDSGTQKFQWFETYGKAGEYYVTFKVSDGILTDKETIKITVKNS